MHVATNAQSTVSCGTNLIGRSVKPLRFLRCAISQVAPRADMLRWFSIRRILLWMVLSSTILISLVFIGRTIYHDTTGRKHTIIASRKARLHLVKEDNTEMNAAKETKQVDLNMKIRDLVIPARKPLTPISNNFERPFQLRNNQEIMAEFQVYQSQDNVESMEIYLWRAFGVLAVPDGSKDRHGRPLKASLRFEKSIKRHVALFYGDYILRGGKEPRHFSIPICKTIGLGGKFDEYSTKSLDNLAGSQGSLAFKNITYALNSSTLPFTFRKDGQLQLVIKYFRINKRKKAKAKTKAKPDVAVRNRTSTKRKEEGEALRVFGKEHYALSSIRHKGVIQPVCYEKQPELRMIYPFLRGSDLVTLSTDHLAFRDPKAKTALSPDDTFLPQFFRQLAEAVYAVHLAGILHLDLKPENFVIYGPDRHFILPWDSPALKDYHLVLLDFGLAMRIVDAEKKDCLHIGTEVTMAPEQIMCNNPAGRGTDWWAVAAAMWRTRIFWEPTINETERTRILNSRCEHWGHSLCSDQPFFSQEFRDLLRIMLKPTPRERDFSRKHETFQRLLDTPYLLKGLDPVSRAKRLERLKTYNYVGKDIINETSDNSHGEPISGTVYSPYGGDSGYNLYSDQH